MQGIRVFAAMLAALVVCGTGIAFAAESSSPAGSTSSAAALSAAPEESQGTEIASKRTATSDTYRLPDGKLKTQFYESPINYRDAEGEWKPIEEGLEYTEGKALENGANSFDLRLPAKMGAGAVRLSEEGQWVSYKLLGEETQAAQLEGGGEGETASYQLPGSGTEFALSTLANGVKEQIEIPNAAAPSAYSFELNASAGLTPQIEEDGSLVFRDSEGEAFAALPAPSVQDSAAESMPTGAPVGYGLAEKPGGGWVLSVAVNREWLAAPGRVFPVEVDPTLTLEEEGITDCMIGSLPSPEGSSECAGKGGQRLYADYNQQTGEPFRSLIRFPGLTPAQLTGKTRIPKGSYISEATLSLNSPEAAENTTAVQVRRLTTGWAETLNWKYASITTGLFGRKTPWTTPGGDYSSEGAEILTSQRGTEAGWWNFSSPGLVSIVRNWVKKQPLLGGGYANDGLLIKNSNESRSECEANPEHCIHHYVAFDSSAVADTHVRPKMTVVYYPPAPSSSKLSSPVEGTVTGRRLKLQAKWSTETSGVTGVTFQYRGPSDKEGSSKGEFHTIPPELVEKANGEAVSWPIAVSGVYESEPVYFDAAHADPILRQTGGEIEVRALFDGDSEKANGYSAAVKANVKRYKGGPHDGTAQVGPGSVDLLSGDFTVSHTDVSIPVIDESSLEFARSWEGGESGKESLLGPGWTLSAPVEAAGGSEWQGIKEVLPSAAEIEEYEEYEEAVPPGYILLTDTEGDEYAFEISGSGFVIPPEAVGWSLSRPESNKIALTDSGGNRTLFEKGEGTNEYKPISVTEAGANKTKMVYHFAGSNRRLEMVIAPTPSGLEECNSSNATMQLGCRALTFTYQSFSYGERLTAITYYGPASRSSMGSWEVAKYAYNSEGRLIEEWDPRITPNLKEKYTYNSYGKMSTLTPPGEEPWSFEYYDGHNGESEQFDGETDHGRLRAVKRASLLSEPSTAQTTIVYGVPLSGSGAPYEMGPSTVAKWGQQQVPTDATAIFPPDQVPTVPPTSYSRATVYYLDAEGETVNTATPSGAGTEAPSITTSEYDKYGNVVRELSAQNRLRSLAAGSEAEQIAKSHELETKRTYNSGGSEPGTEMDEEWGPMHEVRLESGEVVQARTHKVIEYDSGEPTPPSGTPWAHLPTHETTAASVPGRGIDPDKRETKTEYNWTLRKPTKSIVDPNGLDLETRTVYDETTGLPTEVRLPGNPGGGDAHSTKTIYYTAGENGVDGSCGNRAAWANLPCKIRPASQPETPGQPALLDKKIDAYNALAEPTEISEGPGATESGPLRITTISHDAAGRELTRSISGGGTSTPGTETIYNSSNGKPEIQRYICSSCDTQETKTVYDALGRVKEYKDADGNVAKTTYDVDGRPVTTSDNKGSQTRTYDPTSGLLVKLEDSGAGTFTAAYDADGNLTEEGLPDGLVAKTTYNPADEAVGLAYEKKTFCTSGCTWLSYSLERSITGQILNEQSLSADHHYEYDKAGRLILAEETPTGGECTTRSYSYDKDSNRTDLVTRAPGIGGACDTSSKGTEHTYSYDAGDRLTTPSGIAYDNFGRITSLPAEDAGGSTLTTAYFSNEMVAEQSQEGITNTYSLDATGRQRERVETGKEAATEIFHYDGESDSPAWTETSSGWTRNVSGIGGSLGAIQSSSGTVTLELTDPHGDVAATVSSNPEAKELGAKYEYNEFGVPLKGTPTTFGWLGGKERRTQFPSGVIQMGARSYVPQIGRFISPDPVPGGSANAYDYANADPVTGLDLAGTSPYSEACLPGWGGCKCKMWAKFRRGARGRLTLTTVRKCNVTGGITLGGVDSAWGKGNGGGFHSIPAPHPVSAQVEPVCRPTDPCQDYQKHERAFYCEPGKEYQFSQTWEFQINLEGPPAHTLDVKIEQFCPR